jgi:hypothetical protein
MQLTEYRPLFEAMPLPTPEGIAYPKYPRLKLFIEIMNAHSRNDI